MKKEEIARENHSFLVAQVPNCLFAECFQMTLNDSYFLMQDIRIDKREPGPEDFCHCAFDGGYVGVTAQAAEVIKDESIDMFTLATKLYNAFKPGADTGEVNDRITVTEGNHSFVFSITNYETNDPERGWIDVTNDLLQVPIEQNVDRRVIISLAQ